MGFEVKPGVIPGVIVKAFVRALMRLLLPALVVVGLHLFDDKNGNGAPDVGEPVSPHAAVEVFLSGPDTSAVVLTETGADGRVTVEALSGQTVTFRRGFMRRGVTIGEDSPAQVWVLMPDRPYRAHLPVVSQ